MLYGTHSTECPVLEEGPTDPVLEEGPMDHVKVLFGAFILVSSLFALVFIGGTFLIVFPADPLRVGSALLAETGAPPVVGLAIAVGLGGSVLLSAAAPVLLGVGLVVKGVLE